MSIALDRVRVLGAALAITFAVACGFAAPGAHATNLLTCPAGNVSGTYNPPLTNTPALVGITVNSTYGTCFGTSPLTRTGGRSGTLPPVLRSCTDLLQTRTGLTSTISWSTGTTSTVTVDQFSQYITGGILQTTQTGTVTAGDFAGGHIVLISTVVGADPLACATTGVSSASGPLTVTITP